MTVRTFLILLIPILSAACANQSEPAAGNAAPSEAASKASTIPPPVDGWREYPLRDGVISIKPVKWRTDKVEVSVATGEGLEYKLTMNTGDTVVYNISFGALKAPEQMVSEFHGHTEQVDGVGDLMFYSKTGGSPQSGVFTAPWDGIHGWYLKNDSAADVVVTIELDGLYEISAK
jgi:hypothetical protein